MPDPKSVLILENDRPTARLFQLILEDYGYSVRIFTTCKPALEALQDWQPAVAILDYWLEDETCQQVAAKLIVTHVPFVLVTASTHGSIFADQVHADKFLAKPFHIEHLIEIISALAQKNF